MIGTAPAKIILSGEHAVVYGAPALAVAVQRYASVVPVTPAVSGQLTLDLSDLHLHASYPYAELVAEAERCRLRHADYVAGRLPIAAVVTPPLLLLTALVDLIGGDIERLPSGGLHYRISAGIPLGAGMGSSAAVVSALLRLAAEQLGIEPSPAALWPIAVAAEQLQHGRSSGLDPAMSLWGGLMAYRNGECQPLQGALPGQWRLVHTGTPSCTTGECVEQVRQQFAHSPIWEQFEHTTIALQQALQQSAPAAVRTQLQANHRLLCQLGVVPVAVQGYIQQLEQLGAAAKICGAGAVRGDAAGMVLVYHPDKLPSLPLPAGCRAMDMEFDYYGARVRS